MRRRLKRLARPLSFLLLPLSVLPMLWVVPQIQASQRNFERIHESGPLPAPAYGFTREQRERYRPLPAFRGRVPVLAFRGINNAGDGHSVPQLRFVAQLALLKRLGFESISMTQYLRFAQGKGEGLPARPVLLTFDGTRLDSYRGADTALAQHGMRATMFVTSRPVDAADHAHLRWAELKRMQASGRWDIGARAADGDRELAYNRQGDMAPYYAARRFTRSEGVETFADFERRVTKDLFEVSERLASHGLPARAIAVPDANYGQGETNDGRIGPFMHRLLHRQFAAVFVADARNDPPYAAPGAADVKRFEVGTETTVDRLYMWLRDRHPAGRAERRTQRRSSPRR